VIGSDKDEYFVIVLKPQELLNGPDIVAEVKLTGGLEA